MSESKSLARKIGASALRVLIGLLVLLVLAIFFCWLIMIRMPGCSYEGPLPDLTDEDRSLSADLKRDVEKLAGEIGVRNLTEYPALVAAASYIEESLVAAGHKVQHQDYQVNARTCTNLAVELPGADRPDEIVVVGAHYDSAWGAPGADDNASAVAGLLALGRSLSGRRFPRTLRLVAFTNEEPPFFQKPEMGSLVYAKGCQERDEKVVAMLSLEMLGYFTDAEGSQHYPFPLNLFYPSVGNFIGFVGDVGSRGLVHFCLESFRSHTQFPSEGAAAYGGIPGIGFSDHWSFWQIGTPAAMVTDTAFFRNAHYHEESDTPDKLDYDRMARVVQGIERVVVDLLTTEKTWY